jgi:predicted lipid-binding transport protein (Tim44 family)
MTDPVNPEPTSYAAPEPTPYSSYNQQPAKAPVLSIISLIAGILGVLAGFVGWGLLFSIGAVVLGHLGQRKEKAAKGMWLTGLITGYAGVLLNILVLGAAVLLVMVGLNSSDFQVN